MIWSVFVKALKEQLRNYWILLLTLSLAPFFVFVYYLINETEQIQFDVLIYNMDTTESDSVVVNYGKDFLSFGQTFIQNTPHVPLTIKSVFDRNSGLQQLYDGSADVLLILPGNFSALISSDLSVAPRMEIVGNISSTSYLVGAVWMGEITNQFMLEYTGRTALYEIQETGLGASGIVSEFERWMPGMLILSVIMLMFSATIAIITEVDQKTIQRLKLAPIRSWQFLTGVGAVQVLVGIVSLGLTFVAASMLGFENRGCFCLFALICLLATLSMIAFSLLLAGLTKSVTEVLVVGNFPLFLFMFFSGAAFPIEVEPWFRIGGYGISWQSLLSPAPAIQALQKVSILGLGFQDILPELTALVLTTGLYSILGLLVFQRKHLRTN